MSISLKLYKYSVCYQKGLDLMFDDTQGREKRKQIDARSLESLLVAEPNKK